MEKEGGGRREEGRREGGRRRGKEGKQKAEGKQKGGGMELKKRSTTPRYVQRSFVEQGGDPLDPPCPSGGPPGGPCREQQTSAPIVCLGGRTEGGGRRDRELGGEDGGGARQRVEGHGCLKAYTKAREAREGRCRTTEEVGGRDREGAERARVGGLAWVGLGWLGLASGEDEDGGGGDACLGGEDGGGA